MKRVADGVGNAAPRFHDRQPTPQLGHEYHHILVVQVVRSLCSGIVHGDLLEYRVLVGPSEPVTRDLPQPYLSAM
jgi:RIO kinase 1